MSLSFIKKLKKRKSYSPKNKTNLVKANCIRLFFTKYLFFNKGKKFFTHTYSDINVFSYLYNQIIYIAISINQTFIFIIKITLVGKKITSIEVNINLVGNKIIPVEDKINLVGRNINSVEKKMNPVGDKIKSIEKKMN